MTADLPPGRVFRRSRVGPALVVGFCATMTALGLLAAGSAVGFAGRAAGPAGTGDWASVAVAAGMAVVTLGVGLGGGYLAGRDAWANRASRLVVGPAGVTLVGPAGWHAGWGDLARIDQVYDPADGPPGPPPVGPHLAFHTAAGPREVAATDWVGAGELLRLVHAEAQARGVPWTVTPDPRTR